MKNIKIITSILCIGMLWSCSNDEYQDYTAPDELSDAAWLIGLNSNSQEAYSINAGTSLSFMDLSQGLISHEWIIEEGNNFLKEGFGTNDSLQAYINGDVGLSITNPKAHVLFNNSGFNKVRLLNKFNKPVSYEWSEGTLDAVQEGNLWVIDTTFTFDVYANLNPAFKVYKDGIEILSVTEDDMPSIDDIDSWPTVDVEAATALTFEDLSTIGRPNGRSWRYADGTPTQVNGETAQVKFYRLGTFSGEMRSFRVAPLPTSNITKLIPLKVNVIPSTQDFVFDGVLKEAEDESISFRVNGEVVPFSGEENNFTVSVVNPDSGFNQIIPVQSAQVSSDDSIFIRLVLAQPIYNSDQITVTYNNASNGITSADGRILQSFGPENVGMFFGNSILPGASWASFEVPNGSANNALAQDYFVGNTNAQFGDLVWERVTTISSVGSASMRYQIPNTALPSNANLFGRGIATPNNIPAGSYRISYKVFKETGTTINAFRIEFGNPTFDTKVFDISTINSGEWVEVSNTITFTEDIIGGTTYAGNHRTSLRIIEADNPGVTGSQLMYFDDLSLIELEPRQ